MFKGPVVPVYVILFSELRARRERRRRRETEKGRIDASTHMYMHSCTHAHLARNAKTCLELQCVVRHKKWVCCCL